MDDTSLVRIENLSKVYKQGSISVNALFNINLTIRNGEFAALIGPSGSGKTTLLNLIGALDKPTNGHLVVGEDDFSERKQTQLAEIRLKKIGFIFQDYSLLPVLSALENVEYVLLLQGIPVKERRERANEALRQLGLDGYQHRRPFELSGGQQQRVAIARAIVGNPLLVLADEPTANLDSATGEALLETMLNLNRTSGTTFIFSTHDQLIMRHANHVIQLRDGKIIEDCAHAIY
jgi:putative ABC transport system ATP-binding protein